ncbi:isoamylase [Vitiosangium sp. GDMCC 1.1324]|uniref:isoamylase n=1 Tax=Vitiosangium sp. (strain GDMCC 1.1324) TaxID=2138576 RepID=UPI000D335DD2|nr:isoamylase [Vitiosangium sp. GDMCC 1.1324]PTL84960.1 glycogen debranching enzyme [Vitiosangium sp. GDMCC 1.1324]
MKLAAGNRRPWRALLTAGLFATPFLSCGPSPEAGVRAIEGSQEAVGDTQQGAISWTLGAQYDATKANITFSVYSSRATRIDVYLYKGPFDTTEYLKYQLTRTGDVWSVKVPVSAFGTGTVYYGYRAWGPNWPYSSSWTPGSSTGFISDVDTNGNRFNPNKLLLDPYALEISHDPTNATNTNGTIYASGATYRNLDSGSKAPKGIVLAADTTSFGTKPTRALKDDVIYEVHVRGLTQGDTSITSCRGTYAGAAQKAASLAALGVTAVEFLPVQETDNDDNDVDPNSPTDDNYWGYMTLNYFAPDRRYACDRTPGGPTKEFKAMVKAFHDNGIKVFIDVVYNHTGEGGAWSATDKTTYNVFSFRGLDNPTYYSLTSDMQNSWDNTGVGGNFNTRNTTAQNLIIHSLKYWKDELGVDGFRFDLASVLGNTCEHGCYNYDKTTAGTALNGIWNNLSPRPAGGGSGADLIAEPWAIGGNSYQVGNFPSGWAEWNGYYRDTFRKDQNQMGVATVTPGDLATRFAGSSDLYSDDGRKPYNSINFMVAHDGFTLKDLYTCNSKNNQQPWPLGPSDGGEDNNLSWDQGGVAADQRRAARNGIAFLMLSAGTPMITGGDEFLRSQACNNNAYNLDSSANWLNYGLNADQTDFKTFTQRLIAFRKAHPALRPANFFSPVDNNGNVMEQMRWFQPSGAVADSTYMGNGNNHALAFRIDGTEFGDTAAAIYVAYNGWSGAVDFKLPWPFNGKQWYRVTDTCNWAEGANQVASPGTEAAIGGENTNYNVCARGLIVLIAK